MLYALFALMLSTIALAEVSIYNNEPHETFRLQVIDWGEISPNQKRLEDFLSLGIILLGLAGYVFIIHQIS